MLPAFPVASAEVQQLAKILKKLSQQDREAVIAFAEFLQQRNASGEMSVSDGPQEPVASERPSEESVIAAIQRLRESYFMVNPDTLLHETSDLLQSHMLKGRPAAEVIDDLEALFAAKYADYRDAFNEQI